MALAVWPTLSVLLRPASTAISSATLPRALLASRSACTPVTTASPCRRSSSTYAPMRWTCDRRADGPSHDVCTEAVPRRGVRPSGSERRARAIQPRQARRDASVASCARRARLSSCAQLLCVLARDR